MVLPMILNSFGKSILNKETDWFEFDFQMYLFHLQGKMLIKGKRAQDLNSWEDRTNLQGRQPFQNWEWLYFCKTPLSGKLTNCSEWSGREVWLSGLEVLSTDSKLDLSSPPALKLPEWKKLFLECSFSPSAIQRKDYWEAIHLFCVCDRGMTPKIKRSHQSGVSSPVTSEKVLGPHTSLVFSFVLSWTLYRPQRTAMTKCAWIKGLISYLRILGKKH